MANTHFPLDDSEEAYAAAFESAARGRAGSVSAGTPRLRGRGPSRGKLGGATLVLCVVALRRRGRDRAARPVAVLARCEAVGSKRSLNKGLRSARLRCPFSFFEQAYTSRKSDAYVEETRILRELLETVFRKEERPTLVPPASRDALANIL